VLARGVQAAGKVGRVSKATVHWDELPAGVRAAIEGRTGPVTATEPGGEGLNSSLRLVLHTPGGSVFAKGCGPEDGESRTWQLDLGAKLSPFVQKIAPSLLWRVAEAGWNVVGFEYLRGRPWADQKPGSPDIPKMLAVLRELEVIPAPDVLDATAVNCWGQHADDRGALRGDALVHRDMNPTNFVVSEDRAWLVDWGWAVRGPAWLTAAQFVLSLMEAGWAPGAAEEAVSVLPAWRAASPRALAVFAAANARMWDEALAAVPGWPRDFRTGIAHQWADWRTAQKSTVT
jgi:hypothetical protein